MVAKLLKKSGLALAIAAVLSLPTTANAQYWRGGYGRGGYYNHGGISNGAAVGLGLGSFALGALVGSAASQPAYGYGYGYGYSPYGYYAPPPAYYPPPPAYSYRTCWYPQYNGYYAC